MRAFHSAMPCTLGQVVNVMHTAINAITQACHALSPHDRMQGEVR
jgi:hypothetical protein